MTNQKLTRKELHLGYIQQYVIGDYRLTIEYEYDDMCYVVMMLRIVHHGEPWFEPRCSSIVCLKTAKRKFDTYITAAKKLMRTDK